MSARILGVLAAGGLALAAGSTWLVVTSNHDDSPAMTLAFALTAGLSFVGSGLVALWRRPENRTGILLVAVGYLWFLGALSESNNDWVFTAGVALNSVVFGAFVHLLLAFPWGRLAGRRDVFLVAGTYVLVSLGSVALLMVDERPVSDCSTCLSTVAVTNDEAAHTVVQLIVTALALALLGAILVGVGRRFLLASRAMRRVLGPVVATGALTMLVAVAELVVNLFSETAAEPIGIAFVAIFATVPFAFLAGVLRARLARSAVGELLLKLGEGGASLRDALAAALHDPSLDVVYWLPQRNRFVWHDGNPFVDEGGPRTARYVEQQRQACRGAAARSLARGRAGARRLGGRGGRPLARERTAPGRAPCAVRLPGDDRQHCAVPADVGRARRPDRQFQHGLRAGERLRRRRGGAAPVLLGCLHRPRGTCRRA